MSKRVDDVVVETLQTAAALSIMDNLRRELEEDHNTNFTPRAETHPAVAKFRAKQVADAVKSFAGIVSMLARAGVYQAILDQGAEMESLLATFEGNAERTGSAQELKSYASNLIAACSSRYQSESLRNAPSVSTFQILNPLSARECDTLMLLAEGLSNKEIARILAIAPETVKSHVKHIFTKLNVENRVQAVSRARELTVPLKVYFCSDSQRAATTTNFRL
jgi:LuxR family maltose regulon positive regulatory protein